MHDIPLNDTQRIFADKNHNLVYKFLHEKNLPASEYYDIVIFGYLRAVQRYLTDPNLAGYSFATVAWRAMEGEVANTHRTDKRRFRVIRFVRPRQSYAGHLTRRSTPIVTDEEALRERLMDECGTAMFVGFPAALLDIADIESASSDELLEIAERLGVDPEEC